MKGRPLVKFGRKGKRVAFWAGASWGSRYWMFEYGVVKDSSAGSRISVSILPYDVACRHFW